MGSRDSDRPTDDHADRALGRAVFDFERIGTDLPELPLAARRALDHAGVRLSLEGWRGLPVDLRRRLAQVGAADVVDTHVVSAAVRRATPPVQPIDRVLDPDPVSPPPALVRALPAPRTLDTRTWVRLRPLERYALAHAHRRSVARNDAAILAEAFDAVVARPAPRSGSVPPRDPRVEPDALIPRSAVRSSRPPADDRVDPIEVELAPRPITSPRAEALAAGDSGLAPQPPVVPPVPQAARDASELSTHLTSAGEVRMVDVADKAVTHRKAVAAGSVRMTPATIARLARHDTPKGEVLATARVAAILAAKRTSDLVPLCHPLPLTNVTVHMDLDLAAARVNVTVVAETDAKTGVEMEALTAVSVACLTVYDMLKGIDREMLITDIRLLEKSGGRTGHYRREGSP